VSIYHRNYTRWSILGDDKNDTFPLNFHPITERLFHGDNFIFTNDIEKNTGSYCKIIKSPIREINIIPGVLILNLSKTFGSVKGTKKMYYRCIPDSPNYPIFLVAYEMPYNGFNKKTTNQYILFRWKEWGPQQTHPIGTIDRIIGPVDNIHNLYEYEIFCKGLDNPTMRHFAKEVNQKLLFNNNNNNNNNNKEVVFLDKISTNIQQPYIFTIDPPDCCDYDDAISIIDDIQNNMIHLSVYISNVPLLLDQLSIWDKITQVSTIYLPHKKKTMLPTILSDDKLSLRSGTTRDTMVMELIIEKTTSNICDIQFYNSKVYIHRNYHYEEPSLLSHLDYQLIKETVNNLTKSSTTQYITEIRDSHDIVAFLMIMMNHQIGTRLKIGIFRITENNIIIQSKREQTQQLINAQWCCQYIGSYIAYDANNILLEKNLKTDMEMEQNMIRHEALQLDYYLHITSPIRRLVDNINMILFQQQFGLHNYSFIANQFVDKWISNIGIVFINKQTTTIRRLQNKCDIINIMKDMTSVEGTIIGKEGNIIHIYFHSIHKIFTTSFLSTTTEDNLVLSKTYSFCIHFFEDEDKMKKKIRLTLL